MKFLYFNLNFQVGGERYNFFTGVPKSKSCTIILRGGAEQVDYLVSGLNVKCSFKM